MPTWSPDSERDLPEREAYVPNYAISQQIEALLVATWPRWLSPFEISVSLAARSAPRRLRELMEEDRQRPESCRKFEERDVANANGASKHKVYRSLVRRQTPTLF